MPRETADAMLEATVKLEFKNSLRRLDSNAVFDATPTRHVAEETVEIRDDFQFFAIAGESIEQIFHREVHEEAGIESDHLECLGSQTRPCSDQLVLGSHADLRSGDISGDHVKDVKVADARWIPCDDLPRVPARTPFRAGRSMLSFAIAQD